MFKNVLMVQNESQWILKRFRFCFIGLIKDWAWRFWGHLMVKMRDAAEYPLTSPSPSNREGDHVLGMGHMGKNLIKSLISYQILVK